MSHPGAISCRCSLTISRSRRRMRLRRTALPRAFLMLQPNRLSSRPLERRKTVNSRPARLRPSRYTASYSARRSRRHARGKSSRGESDSRETVASFFAALRKDFPSARALHACAEAVLLVTGAHMGLKRAFRQRSVSSRWILRAAPPLNFDSGILRRLFALRLPQRTRIGPARVAQAQTAQRASRTQAD